MNVLKIALFVFLCNSFLFLGLSGETNAKNYYVDSSITDTNIASANPDYNTYNPVTFAADTGSDGVFKTIADINVFSSLQPGDNVYFRRGQIWREQLTVPASGTGGNPITFGAFGGGDKPVISGADVITGWSPYQNNIYVADVGFEVGQLFINGERQVLSRWPNSGYANIDADSTGSTSLYSQELIQPDDYWVDTTISIRTKNWLIETKKVTANSQSKNTITWDSELKWSNKLYQVKENYGFYIENKLEEIDVKGEWYYDSDANKVYLYWDQDPNNYKIEGSARDYGINTKYPTGGVIQHHFIIENLEIKYANLSGIKTQSADSVIIKNNTISSCGKRGIMLCCYYWDDKEDLYENSIIENNDVSKCNIEGIRVGEGSKNTKVVNNKVRYIGSLISPKKGCHGIIIHGSNIFVSGNEVHNTSYNGLQIGTTTNGIISDNHIYNCLLALGDGGGIYLGGAHPNLVIKNNLIHDITGNAEGHPDAEPNFVTGIYLDVYSNGITAQGNVIYNCYSYGIYIPNGNNNTVINNVVYNALTASIKLIEFSIKDTLHDNLIYNNLFLGKKNKQLTLKLQRNHYSKVSAGIFNHNLHYNSHNESIIYNKVKYFKLKEWQDFSGQEAKGIQEDPICTDVSNNDFSPLWNSPAIDSGRDIGVTTDCLGNPIYGTPDIGAYEYQPPYTIGTDKIDITGNVRIYTDGKFRNMATASGNTANLIIKPYGGFRTGDYSECLNIDIETWNISGDYSKKWTETSDNSELTTAHTVGDLSPRAYYDVFYTKSGESETLLSTIQANDSGQISFTYDQGYSAVDFEIKPVSPDF